MCEGKKFLTPSVGEQKNLETKFKTQNLELLSSKDSIALELQGLVPWTLWSPQRSADKRSHHPLMNRRKMCGFK